MGPLITLFGYFGGEGMRMVGVYERNLQRGGVR